MNIFTDPDHAGMDRRRFLQLVSAAGLGLALTPSGLWSAEGAAANNPGGTIDIAVVGLGLQAENALIPSILKISGVRIVAICDIWAYRLTSWQRRLKKYDITVNAYDDYRVMLDKEKGLHAVVVATPDLWHAPITNDALSAGLHVYCEKMMSNTLDGARSMVKTMQKTGKLLQIGHQRRSNPRYLVARNRIIHEAKALGRITTINGQWNRAVKPDFGWPNKAAMSPELLAKWGYANMHQFANWRWFKKLGGGPLSDLGAHQIDIFNWFLDATPTRVIASGGCDFYKDHEWFDNAMVIYEYQTAAGPVRAFYQVQTTTSAGGYYEQFMGTEGTLKMSEQAKDTALYREATAPSWDPLVAQNLIAAPRVPPPSATPAANEQVDARETAPLAAYNLPIVLNGLPHQPHLQNFFNAIRGKAKLNCPADEAFRSEVVVFKAIEAVETGKTVAFTPEDFIA